MLNSAVTITSATTSGTLVLDERLDLSETADIRAAVILHGLGIIGLGLGAALAVGLQWKGYSKSATVIRNLSIGLAATQLAASLVSVLESDSSRPPIGFTAIARGLMVGTSYHLLRQLLNGEGSRVAMGVVTATWLVAPSYTTWCCLTN